MPNRLPPLAAIRAFEAAARHLSFTRAAEELGMTQAAVSYQIKVLEERVGSPLFVRRPRQVSLTEAGLRLAAAATEAFRILADGYDAARKDAFGVLTVSTILTFAANWLSRHLGAFQMANPSLAVRLDTSTHMVDFQRETIDVAIRAGAGNWPGLAMHKLFPAVFTPMLSPKLAASIGGVHEPSDILKLPIVDPTDPWWRQWFREAGVSVEDFEKRPGNRLGAQLYEANAAMAGLGVAILTPAFFAPELANGTLVQPFDIVGDDGDAYWLVYPEPRRNVPKIRIFREGSLAEVATTIGVAAVRVDRGGVDGSIVRSQLSD
jgi:LysR family glycine cleavage system transcriptional activator